MSITITATIDSSGYGSFFDDISLTFNAVESAVDTLSHTVFDATWDAIKDEFPDCILNLDIGSMRMNTVSVCSGDLNDLALEEKVESRVWDIVSEAAKVLQPAIEAMCVTA